MPSMTYWSQLQPSASGNSIAEGLAAQVRDPAWFLCRQWQLGEFEGADAGTTAFTSITARTAPFLTATLGGSAVPLVPGQLVEPLLEAEPFSPGLTTCVELGQTFEELAPPAVVDSFRQTYPLAAPAGGGDPSGFLAVFAGRAIDGVTLYRAAKQAQQHGQAVAPVPSLDSTIRDAALQAVNDFVAWVEDTWGAPSDDEPMAWDASRLEYSLSVEAGGLTLAGHPEGEAALDWFTFDLVGGAPQTGATVRTSVLPGHVRFRGMPNSRWWDFETNKTDFGAILPDPHDLGKLLFADFLLLHGDDWFLAPLDVPAGSLSWVDEVKVTDSFGVTTIIPSAASMPGPRWSMFSNTDVTNSALDGFLFVPSGGAAVSIDGDAVEEVHLLRDETADMAWAVETIAEGPTGAAVLSVLPPTAEVPADAGAAWWYQLITPVPSNWFPLMPVLTPTGAVALATGTVEGGPPTPSGRIVRRLARDGFLLPEEEIGRAGVRLQRVASRSRSSDGRMHLWLARRKQIGAGEASSGLRFDQIRRMDAS